MQTCAPPAHQATRKLNLAQSCAKLLLRAPTSKTRMNQKMQKQNPDIGSSFDGLLEHDGIFKDLRTS
jgi:hypothetical protein